MTSEVDTDDVAALLGKVSRSESNPTLLGLTSKPTGHHQSPSVHLITVGSGCDGTGGTATVSLRWM